MPSIIYIHKWDGGMGCNDIKTLIGYCKEEPKEILKTILYTNVSVYKYLGHRTPIDCRYPNNVSGLVIDEITNKECEKLGIQIIGSFNDLDITPVLTDSSRDKEIVKVALKKHNRKLKLYIEPEIVYNIKNLVNTLKELIKE